MKRDADTESTAASSQCSCCERHGWQIALRGKVKGADCAGGGVSSGRRAGRGKRHTQQLELEVLEEGDSRACASLRGIVLGRGGENVRHICEETGAKLWLIGQGSGRTGEAEIEGPMRLVLAADQPDVLAKAKSLAEDLISNVRQSVAREHRLEDSREKGRGRGRRGGGVAGQSVEQRKHLANKLQQLDENINGLQLQADEQLRERAEKAKVATDAMRQLRREQTYADKPEVLEARTEAAQAAQSCKSTIASQAALESAEAYWAALEKARAEARPGPAGELQARFREALLSAQAAAARAQELQHQAKALKETKASLAATGGIKSTKRGRCCALFASGGCPFEGDACPRGSHVEPEVPQETEVFGQITKAKLRLVQQKFTEAGGMGQLVGAWQVRNPRLEFLFRGAEANFQQLYGELSDVIDAWHGSAESNLVSIATNGFDTSRRCGQAYGAGEYFAKDPNVSVGYANGGAFMFLCKLLLGKANVDHTWAAGPRYYVIKQREGRMQVLPMFLVQFKASSGTGTFAGRLVRELALVRDSEEAGSLEGQQRGGLSACEGRRDAGMSATSTRHLWLGWLSPELRFRDDDTIAEDVAQFLEGLEVEQVVPERNGARVGAFVLLKEPMRKTTFTALAARKYRGQFRISVDDAQPQNPRCVSKLCPRLCGPSRFCRGWNIRGHAAWQWGCPFEHPEDQRPTFGAEAELEPVAHGSAKYDEIRTELLRSMPQARNVRVQRVRNAALERLYEERRAFTHDKQGFCVEKELWHGTSVEAIPTLLQHGLQPPSDTEASDTCPVSGGKGLCTTLCSSSCHFCTKAHSWHKCHMYGLGVYLADVAEKSHQYVRTAKPGCFSMLRCRVVLGNPYLIEGNLLSGEAMHDTCWCQDPGEFLETLAEDWSVGKGHDSYYVKGQAGRQKHGLGVFNNEYIVFQPYQILPLYRVDYNM